MYHYYNQYIGNKLIIINMFVIYLCYEESSEVHIYVTEKRSLHLSICNCVNVYVIVQDHWEEGGGVCVCKGVLNYYYYRFKFWWLHHWNVNFLRWPTPKLWHWAHSGSWRPYNCVFIRGWSLWCWDPYLYPHRTDDDVIY